MIAFSHLEPFFSFDSEASSELSSFKKETPSFEKETCSIEKEIPSFEKELQTSSSFYPKVLFTPLPQLKKSTSSTKSSKSSFDSLADSSSKIFNTYPKI